MNFGPFQDESSDFLPWQQQFGFPPQQPGFPPNRPGPGPGFGPGPGPRPGPRPGPGPGPGPGFPPSQPPGFPPSPGGGQMAQPMGPPPAFSPPIPAWQVNPQNIRGCLYRNTYIWQNNNNSFWFFPIFVSRNSVIGFRWRRIGWIYDVINVNSIRSFQCF